MDQQKAHINIISSNGVSKDEIVVMGYIRLEFNDDNNLLIPYNVKHLCYQYYILKDNKKSQIIELRKQIENESQWIDQKTEIIDNKLKSSLEKAQDAVSNLHIRKIRNIQFCYSRYYIKPIKPTLEAVALFMGKKIKSDTDIYRLLTDRNFMPSILNFDANIITKKIRRKFKRRYISNNNKINAKLMDLIHGFIQKNIFDEYDLYIPSEIKNLIMLFSKELLETKLIRWTDDFQYDYVKKGDRTVATLNLWVKAQYQCSNVLQENKVIIQQIKYLKEKLITKKNKLKLTEITNKNEASL